MGDRVSQRENKRGRVRKREIERGSYREGSYQRESKCEKVGDIVSESKCVEKLT